MPECPTDYTMPKCGPWDGEDRIRWIQLDGGIIFSRHHGHAVDKHGGYYRLAQANSSNLAGFAEVADWPTAFDTGAATHPVSALKQTTTGDRIPGNFGANKTYVFPTSNRKALEGDMGHDFDIVVPGVVVGNPQQCINMNSSVYGVLRLSEIVDNDGDWVAAKIPTEHRYGDR